MKEIAGVDCESVAADLAEQREFFEFHRTPAEIGEHEAQHAALPVARYTGARSNNEQLNLRVGAMRLLGMSDRAIERECGVDRRSIPHRLRWLEETRRIPALKQRLATITGNAAEVSGLVLTQLLQRVAAGELSMELAATIKAVGPAHGITVEKYQLVTGGATERVEQVRPADHDEAERWASSILEVRAQVRPEDQGAIDSESTKMLPAPAQSGAPLPLRPEPDRVTVPAELAGPTGSEASGPAEPSAAGGGGGVAARAAGARVGCNDGVQNL